jgi:hypothetical protein
MSSFIDLPACVIPLGIESLNGLEGVIVLQSPDSSVNISVNGNNLDLTVSEDLFTNLVLLNQVFS